MTGLGAIWGKNCGVSDRAEVASLWINNNYEECIAENKRQRKKWLISFLLVKAIETAAVWWPNNVDFTAKKAKTQVAHSHLSPITQEKYVLGGTLGTLVGFGTGHALQGRWRHKGWI